MITANPTMLPLYIGLGTVIGAIIGGFISTLILRSHKITGYRQEWINSLRINFANIISQAEIYVDVAYQDNEQAYNAKSELRKYIIETKLYLNKQEQLTKTLLEVLEPIPDKYFGKRNIKNDFFYEKEKIITTMNDILKDEWNRVRDGEMLWKTKKILAKIKANKLKSFLYILASISVLLLSILIKYSSSEIDTQQYSIGEKVTWSCFAAIIDVLSKIITTIIAGFGAWVAYQTLLRTPDQESDPKSPSIEETELSAPTEIIVFQTSNQTTKLKATKNGLECYLQDSRPQKQSGHQWTLTTEQTKSILTSHDYRIYPGYKLYSGVFSIGARKNWLYSKKLFPEPNLLELELEKILGKTVELSAS